MVCEGLALAAVALPWRSALAALPPSSLMYPRAMKSFLALAVVVATTIWGCSSSSTGTGTGTGSSSGTTATDGGPTGADAAPEAATGSGTCAVNTPACQGCVASKCSKEHSACISDATCKGGEAKAFSCFCDAQKGANTPQNLARCENDFTCNGACTPELDEIFCAKTNCAQCGL